MFAHPQDSRRAGPPGRASRGTDLVWAPSQPAVSRPSEKRPGRRRRPAHRRRRRGRRHWAGTDWIKPAHVERPRLGARVHRGHLEDDAVVEQPAAGTRPPRGTTAAAAARGPGWLGCRRVRMAELGQMRASASKYRRPPPCPSTERDYPEPDHERALAGGITRSNRGNSSVPSYWILSLEGNDPRSSSPTNGMKPTLGNPNLIPMGETALAVPGKSHRHLPVTIRA